MLLLTFLQCVRLKSPTQACLNRILMPELSVNYSEGWGSPIKSNVCLQAMCFPVSPFTAITTFIFSHQPHIVGWICRNCIWFTTLTKAAVDGEMEFLITAPVMRLFIFWQRLRMRTTGWRRMTERQWSPLHRFRLPPSPLSHSTPAKVRNEHLNEGRGSCRPDCLQWALSFVLAS